MMPPVAAYPAGYEVLEIGVLILILAGIAGMVVWATQNMRRWVARRERQVLLLKRSKDIPPIFSR